MRKLLITSLSILLAAPVIALAQDSAQQNSDPMKQSSAQNSGKATAVKGTISEDGKTLVSDADGKSWTIANPEAVKGHEGHHVELKGSADASTGQIEVTSVKMLKAAKNSMQKSNAPPQQ
jgi:membrane protein implicated in regulation of membrane protease activity